MRRRNKRPLFLSAAVMRRAFQARLLSVDPQARRVQSVAIKRLGGFEDRSFRLRYTVRLRLRTGREKTLHLRGSAETQDQTRRQAYVIMKYLWRHGFDRGEYQITRPVTFFHRWRLLIYEEAAGMPLTAALHRRGLGARRTVEQAAEWLVRLHVHSPRTVPLVYSRVGRKQYWHAALSLLASKRGRDSALFRQAIHRVMNFEDRLSGARHRVLVHHDFHPGNILVSPGGLRVVDFTESRLSDPLVDVATFITQLALMRGRTSPETVAAWQNRFLARYRLRTGLSYASSRAKQIFRFIAYRIHLQGLVAARLFGDELTGLDRLATVEW